MLVFVIEFFYVFNRIDETWYAAQLKQRLENLIQTQFRDTSRLYKTSGLLGFYGYQVKNQTNINQRYGLDSIFAESVKNLGDKKKHRNLSASLITIVPTPVNYWQLPLKFPSTVMKLPIKIISEF